MPSPISSMRISIGLLPGLSLRQHGLEPAFRPEMGRASLILRDLRLLQFWVVAPAATGYNPVDTSPCAIPSGGSRPCPVASTSDAWKSITETSSPHGWRFRGRVRPDDSVRGGSAASMIDTRRPGEADVLETRTVATRVTAVVCADGARP